MSFLLLCASALVPTPLTPPDTSVSIDRLATRTELLNLLSLGPPVPLSGRALELAEQLELLESVPATSSFLALGVTGKWSLRSFASALEISESVSSAELPAIEVLSVEQELDMATEKAHNLVRFRLVDDDLAGTLALDAIVAPNIEREDTINFVTTGRKLQLKRQPSCTVPAMMEALHASLSHDFLGDEGVRLGLQTTYLDEALRITRCTTRSLAASCAVHVRHVRQDRS